MAVCNFCGQSFRNKQAVKAHLKACASYRQMPKGNLPKAKGKQVVNVDPVQEMVDQVAQEQARLELRKVKDVHRRLDEEEAERCREAQRKREAKRLARIQEEEARERARRRAEQEAKERERREQDEWFHNLERRQVLNRVKDEVLWGYSEIPSEVKARALKAIEQELADLPIHEMSFSEVKQLAEGVRDQVYKPIVQALEEEKRKREAKQWGELQRGLNKSSLVLYGEEYARKELEQDEDLGPWERLQEQWRIRGGLEQRLTGSESKAEVRALVEELLGEES